MPGSMGAPRSALSILITGVILVMGVGAGLTLGYVLWGTFGPLGPGAPEPYDQEGAPVLASETPVTDTPQEPQPGAASEGTLPPATPGTPAEPPSAEPPLSSEPPPEAPVERSHNDLLDEQVDIWGGRHLFVSVPGTSLDATTRDLLKEIRPGGVVLAPDNIHGREQTVSLVSQIKKTVELGEGLADLPLIAVDQEGGAVNRLNLSDAPSPRELGQKPSLERTRKVAAGYAKACVDRGIGVILAPVLDVYEQGANKRMEKRCFGEDSRLVSALGLAFADAIAEGGALPVGKHYPGHGTTQEDSHETLAVLVRDKAGLEQVLEPFKAAAAAGIPAIMAGHIAAPMLNLAQPKMPASLSKDLLRGKLREEWGFQGTIIADDIAMKAISQNYPLEDAVVSALAAGCDAVILMERKPARIRAVCKAIETAVEDGRLDRKEMLESMKRLDVLQAWLRQPSRLKEPLPSLTDTEAKENTSADTGSEAGQVGERVVHIVKTGDHLSGLAKQYKVTLNHLREWNNLKGDGINIGQKLIVSPPVAPAPVPEPEPEPEPEPTPAPESSTEPTAATATTESASAPEPAPAAEPSASPEPAPSVEPSASTPALNAEPKPVQEQPAQPAVSEAAPTQTHTVAQGETLYGLARRYGVTVARLREANSMKENDVLKIGQRLQIPPAQP